MKNFRYMPSGIFVSLLLVFLLTAGCGSKKYVAWQCPMKCEDNKTYAASGKCPVCEMDLEGLETLPDTTK